MIPSSFCSKSLIWVLFSFPSQLLPCMFCFISCWVAYICFFILWPFSISSVSILITSAWTLHQIGWLCPCHLALFLELWSVLSFGPYFFVLVHLLCYKGDGALGIHKGRANLFTVLWHCGAGVREGTMQLSHSALAPFSNELSCETGSFSSLRNPHRIL